MALVKTVELRILANAGDAQAKLDELDASAKKLDGQAIRMRFRLDDAEGSAQLDRIKERAEKLGYRDVAIRVRIDGAGKAIAELTAIQREAEKMRTGGIRGMIGNLLFGLPSGGPVSDTEKLGGGALGGLSPAIIGGIAAAVPAVEALLVEVTGLATGFAAAGAGAGAFYLLAHPAINNLQGDIQALNSANQALGYAQQKYLIDPTKQHAKALHEAQVQYNAVYQQMGQDAGSAAGQVLKLHDAYVKVTTAFQPQAFRILGDVAKVLTNALPSLTPFANAFANAMDPLLKRLAGFTASKGFGDFIKQFSGLTGPAVTAIGEGIGKVAQSIGKLLTTMNAADVSKSIGIAFNTIAGIISGTASVVHRLMTNWDQMSSAAKIVARDVVGAFKSMASGIEAAWSTAIGFIQAIPGKIRGFFADAGSWLVNAGRAIIGGLIHGIESGIGELGGALGRIAGFIAAHKGPIEADRLLLVPHGRAIMGGLISSITSMLPALADALGGVTDMSLKKIGKLVEKSLAAQKAALAAQIQQAQQVTSGELSNASIMNAGSYTSALAGGAQPASLTIGGLTSMAADMAQFRAVIAQLRRMGLNAISLGQIIQAGTVQGLPVALGLAQGGPGSIAQINQLERQIKGSAVGIGNVGGPVLYQAGLQAAQGVAAGLKSQFAAVTKDMSLLATAMKDAGKGTLNVVVDVRLSGDKQALALEIVKVLKEYKRHGGNVPLGLS